MIRQFQAPAILILLSVVAASGQSPQREAYSWKNVQIVGAGFADGVIFHSTTRNVRYARTDMGGAYRWDAAADRWQPILDWIPLKDLNLMGVESIAVDPADPDRVYLACGTYTNPDAPNGAILRSDDRGRSFQRTDLPFKLGSNEDGRGNGERLVVDPADGRILYLGTRHDGLWRSQDRGVTWSRVNSFPYVAETDPPNSDPSPGKTPEQRWRGMPAHSDGIVFIMFSPLGAKSGASPTRTIYAGVSLMNRPNLFVTNDGGATWHSIAGEPTQYRPARAALASDGFLYIAYGTAPGPSRMINGGLWKLDTQSGKWSDITPDRPVAGSREFGYAAVSVDAHDFGTVIASTYGRPGGEEIFRSTDGGASWKAILTAAQFDYSRAPYVKTTPVHWLFDIEIDPTDPDHAVFTTGYGGWETYNLTAADSGRPTHWRILAQGIEESVALGLSSPSRGAHLVSAIGDYGGFVHWELDRPAPEGSSAPPRMSNTTGVASAGFKPEVIVRVGIGAGHKPGENIGYSVDGGRTWQPTASAPSPRSRAGSIAVSADGDTWVWTPEGEPAYVTHDRGATWIASKGLPVGTRVIADPLEPHWFYAMTLASRTLYSSDDEGDTFRADVFTLADAQHLRCSTWRGDNRGGQDQIYASPGRSGDLWLAAFDGLYHLASPMAPTAASHDVAFGRIPGVEEIEAFGFGKAAPHHAYSALYLAGTVNGEAGVFRSTDEGRNWVRINDDQHQWGLILQITGDPRIYGRVYVGTHGRGILYGDPASRASPRQ